LAKSLGVWLNMLQMVAISSFFNEKTK
jgi:hypothetical protein